MGGHSSPGRDSFLFVWVPKGTSAADRQEEASHSETSHLCHSVAWLNAALTTSLESAIHAQNYNTYS